MDLRINLILGIVLILYGAYNLFMKLSAPEKLTKLVSMKQELGTKKATYIYVIGYILTPFIAGLLMLMRHFRV
jgi:hypothetical protein